MNDFKKTEKNRTSSWKDGSFMRRILIILTTFFSVLSFAGCASSGNRRIPVKLLILPKFEVGDINGDFPGEGQYFFEEYVAGGKEYTLPGCNGDISIYYRDGTALALLGEGKVCAAVNTSAILEDDRFDFSNAYILSLGCAGGARGRTVQGDVCVVTASADYDLGHHADPRDMEVKSDVSWFHAEVFDRSSNVVMDAALADWAYELVKDVPLETTELTRQQMRNAFPNETWADREPMVIKGTSVSGDNFWKGEYDHANAEKIVDTYHCPDPYTLTEMEDVAVALAIQRFGMLDKTINLRVSVNMDVFPPGIGPENLWGPESSDALASDNSAESGDIFKVAMKNNFLVGKRIADAILNGEVPGK